MLRPDAPWGPLGGGPLDPNLDIFTLGDVAMSLATELTGVSPRGVGAEADRLTASGLPDSYRAAAGCGCQSREELQQVMEALEELSEKLARDLMGGPQNTPQDNAMRQLEELLVQLLMHMMGIGPMPSLGGGGPAAGGGFPGAAHRGRGMPRGGPRTRMHEAGRPAGGAGGPAPGRTAGPTPDLNNLPQGQGSVGEFLQAALNQNGDRYVYGAEASANNPNPGAFDCSELVEWAAAQAGVQIVDGSGAQRRATHSISVAEAIRTPGALLFREGHVAISLGDGRTIEARGRNYGVGIFSAQGRFTSGGLIPGLRYG